MSHLAHSFWWQRIWGHTFWDLFFEKRCPLCFASHSSSSAICSNCSPEISPQAAQQRQLDDLPVYSAFPYLGRAKELILQLKWQDPSIAPALAELIFRKIDNLPLLQEINYIVAVPGLVSPERSWIPSVLLAQHLAAYTGIPCRTDLLQKTEETRAYRLKRVARKQAVQQAYALTAAGNAAPSASEMKEILLVDDLIASGLTLQSCASLLREVWPNSQIYGITFCASAFS